VERHTGRSVRSAYDHSDCRGCETARSLKRENESADTLVRNGFNVEQNPAVPGTKNPDYRVNGEVFDNYARSTGNAKNIWRNVQGKVEAGQAPNVVINLADSPATVDGLVDQFKNYQIPDLQRVIFIDQDGNVSVHLHYKTDG
jgi:filamentous hemagglutinin